MSKIEGCLVIAGKLQIHDHSLADRSLTDLIFCCRFRKLVCICTHRVICTVVVCTLNTCNALRQFFRNATLCAVVSDSFDLCRVLAACVDILDKSDSLCSVAVIKVIVNVHVLVQAVDITYDAAYIGTICCCYSSCKLVILDVSDTV